jgi:hypothetical protein
VVHLHPDNEYAIELLTHILGTIRSEALTKLTIVIHGRLDDVQDCSWADVDLALQSPLLGSVRCIQVNRAKRRDSDFGKRWRIAQIEERLPLCHARGILMLFVYFFEDVVSMTAHPIFQFADHARRRQHNFDSSPERQVTKLHLARWL